MQKHNILWAAVIATAVITFAVIIIAYQPSNSLTATSSGNTTAATNTAPTSVVSTASVADTIIVKGISFATNTQIAITINGEKTAEVSTIVSSDRTFDSS